MPDLKEIKNVEVFAAGNWNGDSYTIEDLDEMVQAFDQTKDKMLPFLKLGHDDKQALIQQDGLPAAGWVSGLRRVGDKLVADFSDIPSKIFSLIQNKAYRKVSSEIYWNVKVGDSKFKRFLSAVSLLGADMPAVTTLNDILGRFKINDYESIKSYAENKDDLIIKSYTFDQKGDEMSDELKKELDKLKADYAVLSKDMEKIQKDKEKLESVSKKDKDLVEKLESEKKELQKFKSEADERAKKAEDEKYFSDLQKQELATPAMKPYVMEFLSDKKEYSVKEKKLSRKELLADMLKCFKALDVNLDEGSEQGQKQDSEAAQIAEVEKYAKENDVSFAKAYKIIMKDKE